VDCVLIVMKVSVVSVEKSKKNIKKKIDMTAVPYGMARLT